MKKQILSISLAAALAVSCTGIAMAEDKTPTVFVNQGQIFFDDQAPVILGEGTTLVPARGVFEAMGAKVEWKEDTRTVDVTSSDNKTLIRLTIDDSTMKVFDSDFYHYLFQIQNTLYRQHDQSGLLLPIRHRKIPYCHLRHKLYDYFSP